MYELLYTSKKNGDDLRIEKLAKDTKKVFIQRENQTALVYKLK